FPLSLGEGPREGGAVGDIAFKVYRLIDHFKRCAHYKASTNPLQQKNAIPLELTLMEHQLSEEDLETNVMTFGVSSAPTMKLKELIALLKQRYEGNVGFEYMHLTDAPKVIEEIDRYLAEEYAKEFPQEEIDRIYEDLCKAEAFESFLHKRHMGKKRFSLEGGESLIPMLQSLVHEAKSHGLEDIVIGMAHRGRLNVLAHILEKDISQIFYEFESDFTPQFQGSGDVKYHMGFSKKRAGVDVTLAPNPSHLESVDPVILGMCRAKQDIKKAPVAIAVTIHGDAALAGQGVVYESLQAMRLEGYEVGGGIHIVINNQVGFTALPKESRSTVYCTDIAKAFSCPVFHVNAMDPVACVKIMRLATLLSRKFHLDVFIDLIGYRKYGHNEGDEPGYTQPLMVEKIRQAPLVSSLLNVEASKKGAMETAIGEHLEKMYQQGKEFIGKKRGIPVEPTNAQDKVVSTHITLSLAKNILQKISKIPNEFNVHQRLKKIIEDRGSRNLLDWAMAEIVAFGSLLLEGIPVRLSGEDSRRGTFSHRHAALVDQKEENVFIPLNHLDSNQAPFTVINSYLSEYAVMGYEFGYTLSNPNALVIWEAQFGDFVNGAQIIIDQYLASCETKWGVTSGLVLYLPHGFEGQGPEHSSARLERFLELGADKNYIVAYPTTTIQFYHLLRAQGLKHPKRPLILFTPKSLLRDEISFSPVEMVENTQFETVIEVGTSDSNVKTCVITFGKIRYEIQRKMASLDRKDIEIISLEQLYPLDKNRLDSILKKYAHVKRFLFVQDEPKNMGGYTHLSRQIEELMQGKKLHFVGRKESSSPASGSLKISTMELEEILKEIFHD
ncbi:MAG: 2-oxoglutarate dehydrogenase E1 component, partial [Chlamydiae bacterium]|nr:2-oxoglutarate dehydrogenase E1 component [Chlamydiota bacterium]